MIRESREASEVTRRIKSSVQDHYGRGVTLKYTGMPTFKIQFKIGQRGATRPIFIERIIWKIWT